MYLSSLTLTSLAFASVVSASGFTTYKQITEGADNTAALTYHPLTRSNTLWVYVQILPNGGDHSALWSDFKTLATAHAAHNISVIPRVRYGSSDGSYGVEPSDANIISRDVDSWAATLNSTKHTVSYPIVQAGFLGQWGEWHDGPFCKAQGAASSAESLRVKRDVLARLRATGLKVALRYPRDHAVLVGARNAGVTLHDDCVFSQGPGGGDSGTYLDGDGKTAEDWMAYAREVAADNGFGGEGCEDGYAWEDYGRLCGGNGLVRYINEYEIAYLNPLNPDAMQKLFKDPSVNSTCLDEIEKALLSHKM